jgi:TolA-binding protein
MAFARTPLEILKPLIHMTLRRTIPLLVALPLLFPSVSISQNTKENADFKLAINLYNDKLYDLAAEQLRQFIAGYPGTDQGIEARYYLGLAYMQLRQYEEARLTFQSFALTYQNNVKAPDAWWNVGESFVAVRNYHDAALAFERVKVFHPKSTRAPEAMAQAGKYFLLAGERDNARRVLRAALQEYPSSPAVLSARTQLGQVYFEEGNLEQARNELKRVVEGDPSPGARAQALLILGNIFQSAGDTREARERYREIITNYRNSSAVQGAYVNLGKLESSAGQYADAVDHFRKALSEDENVDSTLLREAFIGIGNASVMKKEYGAAVTYYERFLSAFPHDELTGEVLWRAAEAAAKGGNYRKSNDLCNRILKSGASDLFTRHARLQLGLNAQKLQNPALAVQLFGAFVDQYGDDPTAPEILYRTAVIQENDLHDYRKASVVYELLFARHPESALVDEALFGAAHCQELLKEFDRSADLYRELLAKYPACDRRAEAEERLRVLETFEAKDKDSGVEKLALLVGDVVSDRDKAGLAFRLGEIYFKDLKNYEAAAAQFTSAYTNGLSGSRTAEALYLRARSYEYLGMKEDKYRSMAAESYQTFLHTTEQEKGREVQSWREEAAVSLFALQATDPGAARTAFRSLAHFVPDSRERDRMLLILGKEQAKSDSLQEALASFSMIAPTSPAHEEALALKFALLTRLNQADSALHEGARFLERYPGGQYSATMLARTAEMEAARGNHQRAAELYQALSSAFFYTGEAAGARKLLAREYLRQGIYDECITACTDLLEQQSADLLAEGGMDTETLLLLAEAQQRTSNTVAAKQSLMRLLALQRTGKTAADAYTLLGTISRDEGSLDLATSYYRQAGTLSGGGSANKDIANLLFEGGHYADAMVQYQRLADSTRDGTQRQFYRARAILSRLRSDDLAGAEKEIAAFARTFKDDRDDLASFELEKGNSQFRQQNYAAAMKQFRLVTDRYDDTPSAPAAMYWIGKTFEASGKLKEAVEQLTDLTERFPKDPIIPRAHLALGGLSYALEQWNNAIAHYRAITDNPGGAPDLLPFAMSNLIETYEIAGMNDAALSLTRRYLDLYPNSEEGFSKKIKIGILYERLGYYDQAVLHLQGLLDEAGSDLEGEIRYYIAEANFSKGDYQQAILDFLKVPYLVTKKGKIDWTANSLYMSGQSYEKMGRFEQALGMYQQILDRPGIDETYKQEARKEIDRVKLVLKKKAP